MQERVRQLNSAPIRKGGKYVLYWAQMNRRVDSNHALAYAIEVANELDVPVLYYEGLTCSYPNANDRLHTFILEGVPDTQAGLRKLGIGYAFYLRRKRSDPNDVLYELAKEAAAVVTDDYPTFIARTHNASVPGKLDVAYFVVDSSCIVPMSRFEKREWAAYTIRPKIKKMLPEYLKPVPLIKVKRKYDLPPPKFHTSVDRAKIADLIASCEIDHTIGPSPTFTGGSQAARKQLDRFLGDNLRRFANERNEPSSHATSGLSPYLHFGHISSLEVALAAKEQAQEHKLLAEEFLEELIVRRELAFNFARFTDKLDSIESLPDWAQKTLAKHAGDARDPSFTLDQLERGETYDDLWNATQKELLLRGKIHGYYRMYWGKKILEWSPTPQEAVNAMIYMHDRYAIDGRDPNTYVGVLWCLGLHDRPFVDRAIFGQVRFMSYDGMKRKTHISAYLDEIRYLEKTGKDPFRT